MSQDAASSAPAAQARSLLTVVRGTPTAAELAAVTVVVAALARSGHQYPAGYRARGSQWTGRDRAMRPPLAAGPGAWRASGLPG